MKAGLKRWIGRVPDVSAVIQRFPIPLILMGILTLIIIFRDALGEEKQLAFLCGGLILSSYFLVSWIIGREGRNKPVILIGQVIFAAIICLISWFSEDVYFNVLMAIAGAILLLGNSIRWGRERDDLHVWDFTHKLWTGAIFAVVGSVIFTLGVLAIDGALKSLFGVDISWFVQDLVLPIGLGFLAPLYWLSTLPEIDEDYQELYENPGFVSKAVAFLGTWLLAPLILIYAAILLAYGAKILTSATLPKGEIAQLTIPFLIIGALTWLVLEPPFVQSKWLAKTFRKIWFWLSIPVSILLGLAVVVRIEEYGLTVERILLLLCVIWALGIGLWFSAKKQDSRDIRVIPGFAAILLLIASTSAPFISVGNQDMRFNRYMEKSGLIVDGTLNVKSDLADKSAAKKAKGALQYLYRKKENNRIEKRFRSWGINVPSDQSNAMEVLGLKDVSINSRYNQSIHYNTGQNYFDISGYDYLYGEFYFSEKSDNKRKLVELNDIEILVNKTVLSIMRGDTVLESFDIGQWTSTLTIDQDKYIVDDPQFLVYETEDKKIAIHIMNLNNWNDENANGNFYLLIKGFKPKP